MPPFLSRRQPELVEWMDREDCDPVRLQNTYRHFARINRWISRWEAVYHRHIRPLLGSDQPMRLLDVGAGGGDIAWRLHHLARRDGFHLEVTGIDPDPRALAFARSQVDAEAGAEPKMEGMERRESRTASVIFRQARTGDLVREGARFHFVTCNHVLHHLPPPTFSAFLEELETLATLRVICSDIERSRLGYLLFSVATAPFFRDSFIRADGLLSIRKSFTEAELRDVLPPGWRVERQIPFRLLALRDMAAEPESGDGTGEKEDPR
jgi:2-polyprenyl-3-methyl-5-hydroxy-6-metoxy-1,4-benzoquinol methylase